MVGLIGRVSVSGKALGAPTPYDIKITRGAEKISRLEIEDT